MSDKLKVLVQVDLKCESARIEVIGLVNAGNVQTLFNLASAPAPSPPGWRLSWTSAAHA